MEALLFHIFPSFLVNIWKLYYSKTNTKIRLNSSDIDQLNNLMKDELVSQISSTLSNEIEYTFGIKL